jgi:hypothetical protein
VDQDPSDSELEWNAADRQIRARDDARHRIVDRSKELVAEPGSLDLVSLVRRQELVLGLRSKADVRFHLARGLLSRSRTSSQGMPGLSPAR